MGAQYSPPRNGHSARTQQKDYPESSRSILPSEDPPPLSLSALQDKTQVFEFGNFDENAMERIELPELSSPPGILGINIS